MPTKYQQVMDIIETEVSWSGGEDHPWKGMALASPAFLERLARLASNAPESMIAKLKEELS